MSIYGGNPEAPKRRQVSIAFFSLSSWLPPPNGTQGTAIREPSARLRFPSSYKSVLLLCTVGFDIQWMGFDSTRPNATPPNASLGSLEPTAYARTSSPEFAKIPSTRARASDGHA